MIVAAGLPTAWLVARAAGLVAFGVLTLSTWLGLGMSTRLLGPKFQGRLLGWHRTLAWTGLSLIGLHVGALMLDPLMHFGPAAVLVPFAAPWRPAAVAAGVVAGWLTLMLAVSFPMRRRIGQRGWRRLHYASFAAFLLSLGHALACRHRSGRNRRADPGGRRRRAGALAHARSHPDAADPPARAGLT